MTSPPVLVLDNGAYTIKAGFAHVDEEPRVLPNSIARSRVEKRVYVADEIDQCRDLSGIVYRRPIERGMLVNWDAEKTIWDRLFSKEVLNVNPAETSLLVTEPYFNLPNICETYDQMVFEEWEFQSYFRSTPAGLVPYGGLFSNDQDIPPACCVMLDVGYSFSHVIPVKDGQIIWEQVRRIDIGGKFLTNHLKHLISFRQWNMADETHVVNGVKEACCYVSMNWKRDIELCKQNSKRNPIVQEYVLPDFSTNSTSTTGYIRSGPNAVTPPEGEKTRQIGEEEEQVLYMGNERFQGPELLFNPSDIGLNQTGLADTIAEVISNMPEELRGMYWANIGIFGGLGYIEALGERLELELRRLCPCDYEIGIFEAFDPPSVPYTSACALASSDIYLETYPVTRAEYLENGSSICRRRFGGPAYNATPPGFVEGDAADVSDDERERRYALGLESIRGKGSKGKRKVEEQEVTSGNWGGRRRRAGLL